MTDETRNGTGIHGIRLEYTISREDSFDLTPEESEKLQDDMTDMLIEWLEDRGYLMNGVSYAVDRNAEHI